MRDITSEKDKTTAYMFFVLLSKAQALLLKAYANLLRQCALRLCFLFCFDAALDRAHATRTDAQDVAGIGFALAQLTRYDEEKILTGRKVVVSVV